MTISRFLIAAVLILASTISFATDEEGEILLADLERLQLSLEGSPHYYSLTPETGGILLNKHCVPEPDDCEHQVFVVWDYDGDKVFDQAPHIDVPEVSSNRIRASTLLTANRLVFSTVVHQDGWVWSIAQYDIEKGDLVYLVPTRPIRCQDLLGDDRGVIWCLGDDHAKRADQLDHDLVYRFDHGGKLIGSSLPRSGFPEDPYPLTETRIRSGFGGFLPGNGVVRLWLPAVGELISFDSDGKVEHRLTLPTIADQQRAWLVSALDNEVYGLLISASDPEDRKTVKQILHVLSPDGSSWIPLQDPPIHLPLRIKLAGADEKGLILLDRKSLELLWYPYEAFQTE